MCCTIFWLLFNVIGMNLTTKNLALLETFPDFPIICLESDTRKQMRHAKLEDLRHINVSLSVMTALQCFAV